MAVFVLDASVCLAWCFEDEITQWTNDLFTRLRAGDRILVPAHWPTEVSNGLLIGVRRQRIKPDQPAPFWDEFANLPIVTKPALTAAEAKAVLILSESILLTVYDAAYLELALRKQLPFETLDADLRRATNDEGIALL
jgi:predicted nucleic acid-binding protein